MAIEPGFQVRLGIYGIDDRVVNLRPEIWRLLAPRLDRIIENYLANVIRVAPLYRKKMSLDIRSLPATPERIMEAVDGRTRGTKQSCDSR